MDGEYDVLCVGAGLSGAVIAERFARIDNKKVLVIDSRNHIGGNVHDHVDPETNIRVSSYGAKLFHTNMDEVMEYVRQFSEWTPYEHRVLAKVEGRLVPVPVNITTVNELMGTDISTPAEMDSWLQANQVKYQRAPENGEEAALSRVGRELYEKIFETYTKKQWDLWPRELAASVLQRIPVRNNFDDRYFSDKHQYLPTDGYTKMFENLLGHPNITVVLNTDYFDVRDRLKYQKMFFTGQIDRYFEDSGLDKLQYRSIRFEWETLRNTPHLQPNSVVNYPGPEVGYTRIVEYKHFLNQTSDHTIVSREYSTDQGPPYYPVPNPANQSLYERYRDLARAANNPKVVFVGRLASYKYLNMDEAIATALTTWRQSRFEGGSPGGSGGPRVG